MKNPSTSTGGSKSATGFEPTVALIFPPLVETNFGAYYPSTAVLAAFLLSEGISSLQIDLNEEFAEYLLRDDILDYCTRLIDSTEGRDSMSGVAARLLRHRRKELFDEQGRHCFRVESSGPAHLLAQLARLFHIDVPISDYRQSRVTNKFFRHFFTSASLTSRIPPSVRLIGISVAMGPQLVPALLLAEFLRELLPDAKIVLGGPAISLLHEFDRATVVRAPGVDCLVRFEGELPLAALARQSEENCWDPTTVPGTTVHDSDGMIETPAGAGLHLDCLPFGLYDPTIAFRLANLEIGVIQARGCYWGHCTYCDFVELYEGSPAFRTKRAARLVDEIEFQMARLGAMRFSIITEALPPAFAMRMADEIQRRGLKIQWHSFVMVDRRFTPTIMNAMVEAGCENVIVGMETMNNRVLALVKKLATCDDNIEFLKAARSSRLRVKVNLIPDLPSTTYSEAMNVLELLQQHKEYLTTVSVFPFEATRSSEIGRKPTLFKLTPQIPDHPTGQAQFASNHLHVIDVAMTPSERKKVHDAYFAFSRDLQPVSGDKFTDVLAKQHRSGVLVALARDVDLFEMNGISQCYRLSTRSRYRLPKVWLPVLRRLQERGYVPVKDCCRWLGADSVGEAAFQRLQTCKLLSFATPDELVAMSSK